MSQKAVEAGIFYDRLPASMKCNWIPCVCAQVSGADNWGPVIRGDSVMRETPLR